MYPQRRLAETTSPVQRVVAVGRRSLWPTFVNGVCGQQRRGKSDICSLVTSAGRSGLVVSASDCGVRGPKFESLPWTVVFIATAAAIYSLGHGLCTLTAVPRST